MTTGDCGQSNRKHSDSEGFLIKKLNDCQIEIIRRTAETKTPAASMSTEWDDESACLMQRNFGQILL